MRPLRLCLLALAALPALPLMAQSPAPQDVAAIHAPVLTDEELAKLTGKFLLPGGVEIALSITSDTVLNGMPVLRTVFTVDQGSTLAVYGRRADATATMTGTAVAGQQAGAPMAATGIAVEFDRHSGIQTITPTYTAAQQPSVTLGAPVADAAAQGLAQLAVTPGGPAVQTPDGLVSVRTLANGSLVSLAGDQLQASHLVGQSVATALVNSGNDRVFDTVTNVAIDLRNIAPYQLGAAALRADSLALDATRSMIR